MSKLADRVYSKLREVPKGRVVTYKWLAESVGTKGYQAIGQILRRNPDAPETPCHRVVSSDGGIGGFMGEKSGSEVEKKIVLLRDEGVDVRGGKIDLSEFGYELG